MLIAKGIKKKYEGNSFYSVKGFSYSFNDTGLYLIVGPSGSGKTTLLGILAGIDDQYEGELTADSTLVSERTRTLYRNRLSSIVFQDVNFVDSLSIEDNLRIAFDLTKEEFSTEKCVSVLREVNLPDENDDVVAFLKKKPTDLSGGQRQRLAIARALIKKSKFLFLDEPTSALDENNAKEIIRILYRISETTLVIVVSHLKDFFYLDSRTPVDVIDINGTKANELALSPKVDLKKNKNTKISSISHLTALKIACTNILSSKLRLFISGLITILSFVSFMFLYSAKTIDRNEVMLRTQIDINQSIAIVSNTATEVENGDESAKRSTFSVKQKELLNSFNAHPVFYSKLNMKTCIDEKYYDSIFSTPVLNFLIDGELSNYFLELWSDNDSNFAVDHRLTQNETCHSPAAYDEIAISSVFADALVTYGSETNGFHVTDVSQLIGKKIGKFSISAIYETKDYQILKQLTDSDLKQEERIRLSQNSSYSQLLYVSPGFYDYWMSQDPYHPLNPYVDSQDDAEASTSMFFAFEYSDFSDALKFVKNLNVKENEIYYSVTVLNILSNSFNLDEMMKTNVSKFVVFAIVIFVLLAILSLVQLFSFNISKEKYCFGVLRSLGCGINSLMKIAMYESTLIMSVCFLGTLFLSLVVFTIYNNIISIPLLSISLVSWISLLGIVLFMGLLLTLFGTIKSSKTNIRLLLKKVS